MRRHLHPVARLALVLSLAGCGNLTCDSNKKESIRRQNLGVQAAKARVYDKAEKELQTATELFPGNHEASYALGQVFADQKKWDRAGDAFAQAVKHSDGEAMYHYKLGQALFESGKDEAALKSIDRALALNDRLFKAHYFRGKILGRLDRPKDAAAAWTEACRLNPGFGKAFVELGQLYVQWDFLEHAVAVLSQGAQYARDADDQTNIYYYLGMAYDGLKDYAKAADAYLKAIESKRDNVEARLQAGLAFANAGDTVKAKLYLEEFVKLGGGNNAFNIQAANDRLAKLAY